MKCCYLLLLALFVANVIGQGQVCQDSSDTSPRGNNPHCINPVFPYCIGGQCNQCNSQLDYICDCNPGLYCNNNPGSASIDLCQTPPLYGSSCTSDSNCLTTWGGGETVQLVCVSGECRMCDPSSSSNPVTNCTYGSQIGKSKSCIAPGIWGTPTTTTTTTSSVTSGSTALVLNRFGPLALLIITLGMIYLPSTLYPGGLWTAFMGALTFILYVKAEWLTVTV